MSTSKKTLFPLIGVVPIVLTPFNDDGSIDFASLEREVEHGIKDGVAGFIVPAVASEVNKLTEDERKQLTVRVISQVKGRVPVVIGASHPDAKQSRGLAEYGMAQGAAGILCSVPIPIIDDKVKVKAYLHEVAKARMTMLMV
ncbi:MAG: dihydrodipicolinate synthase family protein [SAR202 cluster bacterium]|nr:dihydrodipicolinate synthase family protein [SAR202 cluster bacterium]